MKGTPVQIAREILARRGSGRAGILLDYDGTVVEITDAPSGALLDSPTRALLLRLATDPRYRVALVTGRDLPSLAQVAGELPGIALAANGGLVIREDGREWTHPEAAALAPELELIRQELEPQVARWPGALIEAKTLSLTVHFRGCPESGPTLQAACRSLAARHGGRFRLLDTKHGVEIQPDVEWDKGRAVGELLDRWGLGAAGFYAGDNLIDEPAFDALRRRGGVSCRVTTDAERTHAEWALSSVSEVHALLAELLVSPG